MSQAQSLAEIIEAELIASGGSPGSSLHSWRCEHPEQYGPCGCVAETAHDIVVALLASGAMVEEVRWNSSREQRRLVTAWQERP